MRKTSYVVTFLSVVCTLLLNLLSDTRPDWLIVHSPEILGTKITVTYGLAERCEQQITRIPGSNGGNFEYSNLQCRAFPAKAEDRCDEENRGFCIAWTSARYVVELAIWCSALSLCTIIFGVSTHSRRRRIWRAVAGLVLLHALFQIVAFAIVTELYQYSRYPTFEQARPGFGYVCNTVSWVLSLLIAFGVITTGISADKGHKWAAGNRPHYRRVRNYGSL